MLKRLRTRSCREQEVYGVETSNSINSTIATATAVCLCVFADTSPAEVEWEIQSFECAQF